MNRTLALAATTLALAACQQTLYLSEDGGPGSGTGGRSATTDGGNPDRSCSGSGPVTLLADAPQMVVVLDRSGNMSQMFGSQQESQLHAALNALGGQLDIFNSGSANRPSIALSFLDFPDTGSGCQSSGSCCAGDPKPWADFSQGFSNCEMEPQYCVNSNNRPMAAALAKAHDLLTGPGSASSYQRYILLITDGPPSGCSGGTSDDCMALTKATQIVSGDKISLGILALQSQPATDLGCLVYAYNSSGQIAQSVADPGTLASAINLFMQSAVCNAYLINPTPSSPSDLTVTYQGNPVRQDPSSGWSYDSFGRLHLHGSACQMVLGGGWNNLKVMATCPPPHQASGSSF